MTASGIAGLCIFMALLTQQTILTVLLLESLRDGGYI